VGVLPGNRRARVCSQVLNGMAGGDPGPLAGPSARLFSKDRVLGLKDQEVFKR